MNDNSETKKRILQEIANLKKDSDRDVRDNIIMASSATLTNENDETSNLSQSEIPNEISVISTPSPPTVPLQINIYESPSTDDDESNEKSF